MFYLRDNDIFRSCDDTLDNLGTDHLDLHLLPWMREHGVALMAYCPLGTDKARHKARHELRTFRVCDALCTHHFSLLKYKPSTLAN